MFSLEIVGWRQYTWWVMAGCPRLAVVGAIVRLYSALLVSSQARRTLSVV